MLLEQLKLEAKRKEKFKNKLQGEIVARFKPFLDSLNNIALLYNIKEIEEVGPYVHDNLDIGINVVIENIYINLHLYCSESGKKDAIRISCLDPKERFFSSKSYVRLTGNVRQNNFFFDSEKELDLILKQIISDMVA